MKLPPIEQYKQEVRELASELKKPWTQEFLTKYFPDQAEDQKFQFKFDNFLYGKGYYSGYVGPAFMEKLKEFHQLKLKEYKNGHRNSNY